MKKLLVTLAATLFYVVIGLAQTPQIALVRLSTNQTQIFTTLQSAYAAAVDNDYIYLPGGSFTLTDTVKKKLNFIGAGIHPDSSTITGRTVITTKLIIAANGSGTTVEGIVLNYTYCSSSCDVVSINLDNCNNVLIKNCEFNTLWSFNGASNNLIIECISKGYIQCNNSTIKKCIISGGSGQYSPISSNSYFYNNIFLGTTEADYNVGVMRALNSRIENNIFLSKKPVYDYSNLNCGNQFVSNLKIGSGSINTSTCSSNPSLESGTMSVDSVSQIFANYPNFAPSFSYVYDYHLKASSLGKNAGTDGTDLGIYGTNQPTKPGWVPSNPHIYYKAVSSASTNDGKLQIQFKVRTGN